MNQLPRNTILGGDATERLRQLPMALVDCVITSPPYYQLCDYGMPGQIGLEPTVSEWVTNVRTVLAQVAQVLKPTGALWLNLGDSFSRHPRCGGLCSEVAGPDFSHIVVDEVTHRHLDLRSPLDSESIRVYTATEV